MSEIEIEYQGVTIVGNPTSNTFTWYETAPDGTTIGIIKVVKAEDMTAWDWKELKMARTRSRLQKLIDAATPKQPVEESGFEEGIKGVRTH